MLAVRFLFLSNRTVFFYSKMAAGDTMKMFLRIVTAVCLTFTAVVATSQLAETAPAQTIVFNPRSDGMYHVADAPGTNFDEKLAACFTASDAATPDMLRVHIDWVGTAWKMTKPVELRPKHGNQLRVRMTGDDFWYLIDWQGSSGLSQKRVAVFRFFGLKESRIEGVKIVTRQNYVIGFQSATDTVVNSSSNNVFRRCRVQSWDGTVGNVGFWDGYSTDKTGHNDHSANVFEQCSFDFYPSGSTDNNGAAGVMAAVCQAGHRGFVFSGYNTLSNVLRDCNVVNAIGVTTKSFEDQDPGGSSTVCDNFGSSGSPVVFDLNIGFAFSARGGRHELGGMLLVQGFAGQGNGNASYVSLSDIQCEDFLSVTSAKYIGTTPGVMVSAHDATNLTMSNVKLWNMGSLGEKLTTGWMEMNCTEPTQRPVVNIANVLVGNGTGDKSLPIAFRPVVKAGTWKKVVDGAVSIGVSTGIVQ